MGQNGPSTEPQHCPECGRVLSHTATVTVHLDGNLVVGPICMCCWTRRVIRMVNGIRAAVRRGEVILPEHLSGNVERTADEPDVG
jgi:hypothetical protein